MTAQLAPNSYDISTAGSRRRLLPRSVHRQIIAEIETLAFEASAELTHQRGDLAAARSDANNAALAAALQVAGLPPLARELIQRALVAENAEDDAIRRAESAARRRTATRRRLRARASGR